MLPRNLPDAANVRKVHHSGTKLSLVRLLLGLGERVRARSIRGGTLKKTKK